MDRPDDPGNVEQDAEEQARDGEGQQERDAADNGLGDFHRRSQAAVEYQDPPGFRQLRRIPEVIDAPKGERPDLEVFGGALE